MNQATSRWVYAALILLNLLWMGFAIFMTFSAIPFVLLEFPRWGPIAFLTIFLLSALVQIVGLLVANSNWSAGECQRAVRGLALQCLLAGAMTAAYQVWVEQ
ncbi:MAG: hypothetical protein M3438_07845 [Pseudomonadota bacterium]|nr:hypothetical protein [Pseudomonadota bacterium]